MAELTALSPAPPQESNPMALWFEIAPYPWSDPRAVALRDLLVHAYADVRSARILAQTAGVRLGNWNTSGGMEQVWASLLETATNQAMLGALLDRVLADRNVAGFHPELRSLRQDKAPRSAPTAAPDSLSDTAANTAATPSVAASSTGGASPKGGPPGQVHPGAKSPPPPAPPPQPVPEKPLFSWIHLSDIHMGLPSAGRGWDQEMVLDALARDTEKLHRDGLVPAPRAIFVTGDIAFSGKPEQHEKAAFWLEKVAATVGLSATHVYLVPGNHDVDRDADKDRHTKRLLGLLRDGKEDLDEALKDPGDRALLAKRMAAYVDFAKSFGSPADLHWSLTKDLGTFTLNLLGLNTAILAADSDDHGKLRLGNEQLARLRDTREDQLTLVLTHHPFAEGWLHDEKNARDWIHQRADIHLCGHTHDAEAAAHRTAGGTGIVTVVAGASHGDKQPDGVPETHGYNWAGVFRGANDRPVLRVWPRVWSRRKDFRLDVNHVPEGKLVAEHDLHRIRLPAAARRP